MSNHLCTGYLNLRIKNAVTGEEKNSRHPNAFVMSANLQEGMFNDIVGGRGGYSVGVGAMCMFLRTDGGYRYEKDTHTVLYIDHYNMSDLWDHYWAAGSADYMRRRQYPSANRTATLTEGINAVASFISGWDNYRYLTENVVGFPTNYYGIPAISFIDLQGTAISPLLFKHEKGFNNIFNHATAGTDIALSQGDVEIEGVYSPDYLQHRWYCIYYANEGGTGIIDSGVGERDDGSVSTGSDTFTANSGTAPFAGDASDVGRYIVIKNATNAINNGVFEITAFISTTQCTVDATTINQPFVTEGGASPSGLEWTLRDGPVGEYLIRRNTYTRQNTQGTTVPSYAYGGGRLYGMRHEYHGTEEVGMFGYESVFDRGASWWWIHRRDDESTTRAGAGINRWLHMAPRGFDPVYQDGDIQNMPTGIRAWRSINIDDENKIWAAWSNYDYQPDPPHADKILARIDPYPSGNARYPAVTDLHDPGNYDLFEAQTGPTDDEGLCSNYPIGICCDEINGRVIVAHNPGNLHVGETYEDMEKGGFSYTENAGAAEYGDAWKRLHLLHSASGTVTPSGTTLNGTSTFFQDEFAVGDWIRPEPKPATGQITSMIPADYTDGDWFTLDDGLNDPVKFFFDVSGSYSPGSPPAGWQYVTITITGLGTDVLIADQIRTDVNGTSNLDITAGNTTAQVDFTADNDGDRANNTITEMIQAPTKTLNPSGLSGGIIRAFEITGITNQTTMTISPTYPESYTNLTIEKGALTAAQAVVYTRYHTPSTDTSDYTIRCYVDYDKQGNFFWVSDDGNQINKWSFSKGYAESRTTAEFSRVATDKIRNLVVTRFKTDGFSDHAFEGNVWTGSFGLNAALRIDNDGTNDFLKCQVTQYHHSASDNWPTEIQIRDYDHDYGLYVLWNPNIGALGLWAPYSAGIERHYWVINTVHSGIPLGYCPRLGSLSELSDSESTWSVIHDMRWDDVGMNNQLLVGHGKSTDYDANTRDALYSFGRMSYLWDGQSWYLTHLVSHRYYDLDFENTTGDGPFTEETLSVGNGLKRMHDDFQLMQDGLYIRFVDSGAASQTDEFVQDETTTFAAYIGVGKDNTQEVEYSIERYSSPTVHRDRSEPMKGLSNMWTVDGGIDGGYIHDLTVQRTVPFHRGVAEYDGYASYGQDGSATGTQADYYYNFFNQDGYDEHDDPDDAHFMAALRIKDESDGVDEFPGDGFVTNGSDVFTTETYAVGSITALPNDGTPWSTGLKDGDTFTLDDGVNSPTTFWFDASGSGSGSGVEIDISAVSTPGDVADLIRSAINSAASLDITADSNLGDPYITLKNDATGSAGNQVITESLANIASLRPVGMRMHTFSAADEGKSIFIENATTAGNNGQAVILEFNPSGSDPNEVKVDRTFNAGDESGVNTLRWKLRDIPAVAYVVYTVEYTDRMDTMVGGIDWKLYSSRDHGSTWTQVKKWLSYNGVSINDPLSTVQDHGVYWNDYDYVGTYHYRTDALRGSPSLWFDLRDLPEASRRRQYWKVYRSYYGGTNGQHRFSSVRLLDANGAYIGVLDTQQLSDRSDEHYVSNLTELYKLNVFEGGGTIAATDDNDGDNLTYILTTSTTDLYEDTGSGNAKITRMGNIQITSDTFVPTDVGKLIRISDANDSDNDGFANITTYINAREVITDKAFTYEDGTFDWQILYMGEDDQICFYQDPYSTDDTFFLSDRYMPLRNFNPQILDVPANNTIYLKTDNVPLQIGGTPFSGFKFFVYRALDTQSSSNPGRAGSTDINLAMWVSQRGGGVYASDVLEFITLIATTAGATSPADDDGDSRTDIVDLPVDVNAFDVAVGDYIVIEGNTSNYGRRVHEIRNINVETLGAAETWTLTALVKGSYSNGDYFVMDDGINPVVSFYLDVDGLYDAPAGTVEIDISGTSTAIDVANAIRTAILEAPIRITPDAPGAALINLTADQAGTQAANDIQDFTTGGLSPTRGATASDGTTQLQVWYDEILVSKSFSFSIVRRRPDWKLWVGSIVIVAQEQI